MKFGSNRPSSLEEIFETTDILVNGKTKSFVRRRHSSTLMVTVTMTQNHAFQFLNAKYVCQGHCDW